MRIDGVPWRSYARIWVEAILFGALIGAVAGGGIEQIMTWWLG